MKELLNRRIPQILGSYLVAGTSLILFIQYLVDKYQFPPHFPTLALFGVMGILPSVIILAYFHGAPGKDSWTKIEKIGIPINILFLGICLFIGKNQDFLDINDEKKDPNRYAIMLTNPMSWKNMFKKNPEIQTYLSNNKNANIFNIPIDTLKKINSLLESNLLYEFYDENLLLDFRFNDENNEKMTNILESNKGTKDVAMTLYDLFDKPDQTIYVFITAIEKNGDNYNKFISYMFHHDGNPNNGGVAVNSTEMINEISDLSDEISKSIASRIWGLENNYPTGMVLTVDDDIIVFNPNKMKVKKNMILYGNTTYSFYDNDNDGYTDKDENLQKRIDDLQSAVNYMKNYKKDFSTEEINEMENELKKYVSDKLQDTAQGYYTWQFGYIIKVINVADSSVVAKLIKRNTPWSKIRPGDRIVLD